MRMRLPAPGSRGGLLLAMLALVLISGSSIAGLMLLTLFDAEEDRALDQLRVAESVTRETINRRNQLLLSNLQVVVEDFGFKSAIAGGDRATMESALSNHSDRTGARLALLLDEKGRVLAGREDDPSTPQQTPFPELLDIANREGVASEIVSRAGLAYQALMIPIRGPGLRAWMLAGFPLDDAFARSVEDLTGSNVLIKRQNGSNLELLASSLAPADDEPELTSSSRSSGLFESDGYFIRALTLSGDDESGIRLLLLNDRSEALSTYNRLAWDLAIVVLAVLAVATVLVLLTARTLGRPVLELARFAQAIGAGKRVDPPQLRAGGELKTLRQALSDMLLRVRRREHTLRHNASHDDLTGLLNRKAMDEQLQRLFSDGEKATVLGIEVADFKALNDTLGLAFGDRVLIAVGLRLRGELPPQAPLGRTGASEFLTLLPAMPERELQALLAHIRNQVETTTLIQDTPINLQLRMALLSLPDHADNPDEVRRRLNLTFRETTTGGRQTAFYQPGGDEDHLRELRLIRDLDLALASDHDQLSMRYQPKVALASARPVQVEALVRWQHPELGFISPEEFILLAERSGQIHRLTGFVLERIARERAQWLSEGLALGVAINLSALDVTRSRLPQEIASVFRAHGQSLDELTFEITESALMQDAETALETLHALRELGATLSVDDFGTGYSSLAQLRQLPVQELKIDKSFVLKLNSESQDRLIVGSTIELAHSLGLQVVAEGVENLESWQLLRDWGCDKAQGFFMARPMPAAELAGWAETFKEQATRLGSPVHSTEKQR